MGSIASGGYSEALDGERVLARMDHFLVVVPVAPQRPAQLADHRVAVEENQLTDERGPMAVDAPVPPFPERAHARPDEVYFENGSRPRENGHEAGIRRSDAGP